LTRVVSKLTAAATKAGPGPAGKWLSRSAGKWMSLVVA
jgi:hypothetical protein